MKLVEASLYTRKDVESTLHCCGSPVKLVHACLSVRNDLDCSFHQCGGHEDRGWYECTLCRKRHLYYMGLFYVN